MVRNILLTIEYDGTNFSGWQIQPDCRTVQGEIQKAVSKICGERNKADCIVAEIKVDGTSRTDAGVHAYGQRASFKGEFGIPIDRITYVMNNLLPEDIKICEAKEVALDFHARFDARGKKYVYKIMNCDEKNVFKRNFYYFVNKTLDIDKMRQAASYLVGTHDFAAFMAMGSTPQKTTVRTIYSYNVEVIPKNVKVVSEDCSIISDSYEIILEVSGDGFLYNMVRIMTGTLVEVGLGKINPEEIPEIIESKDRSRAGHTAPPQGLYLAEIYY